MAKHGQRTDAVYNHESTVANLRKLFKKHHGHLGCVHEASAGIDPWINLMTMNYRK